MVPIWDNIHQVLKITKHGTKFPCRQIRFPMMSPYTQTPSSGIHLSHVKSMHSTSFNEIIYHILQGIIIPVLQVISITSFFHSTIMFNIFQHKQPSSCKSKSYPIITIFKIFHVMLFKIIFKQFTSYANFKQNHIKREIPYNSCSQVNIFSNHIHIHI